MAGIRQEAVPPGLGLQDALQGRAHDRLGIQGTQAHRVTGTLKNSPLNVLIAMYINNTGKVKMWVCLNRI